MASSEIWLIVLVVIIIFIFIGAIVYLVHIGAPASSFWWLVGAFVFLLIIFFIVYLLWRPARPAVVVPPPVVPGPVPVPPNNINVSVAPQPGPVPPEPTLTAPPSVVHQHFYGAGAMPVAEAMTAAPIAPVATAPVVSGNYPPGTAFGMPQVSQPGYSTFDEDSHREYIVYGGQQYRAVGPRGVPGTVTTPPKVISQQVDRPPVPISNATAARYQQQAVPYAGGYNYIPPQSL